MKLDALRVPPVALFNLFMDDTPAGREFRKNIVQYNSALAFTSLGVNIYRSKPPFSAVAHLSFAFTENLNISLDLYCLSLVVIHATVNFTFMIRMQPINFECLAMAISL